MSIHAWVQFTRTNNVVMVQEDEEGRESTNLLEINIGALIFLSQQLTSFL